MAVLIKALAKRMDKCEQIQINMKMAKLGNEFDVEKSQG